MGYPCPPYTNPAEHILDLATGMDIGDAKRRTLVDKFPESKAAEELQQELQVCVYIATGVAGVWMYRNVDT